MYDGLRNSTCYDHAVAFVKHWEELGHRVAVLLAFADSLMRGLVATELCCTGIRCSLQSTGCMPEAVQISARQAQGLVSN